MDPCFSAREDEHLSNAQGERSMPFRGQRLGFSQRYDENMIWTPEVDTAGLPFPPDQQAHHRLDASSNVFGGEEPQQLAWPSTSVDPDVSHLTESHNQAASQRPTVATGEFGPSPPTSHSNRDEDDELSTESGEDDGQSPNDTPKTAEERRAEKRKMKRFRLTHNQTRFLMSEFARQAHPDASQRERLSREIPGLSPRQVQVWFQNRRAKLKRLTVDDQESMLKSRALPAGFNTAQTLNNAYEAPRHANLGGPSSFFDSSHPDFEMRRSLITGGLGLSQDHDDNISPTSVVSNFIDASFPVSEAASPISPLSDRTHFYTPPTSQVVSPPAGQSHPYSPQNMVAYGGSSYNLSHPTTPIEEAVEADPTVWAGPNIHEGGYVPYGAYGSLGATDQTQHSRPVPQMQSAPLAAPPEFYLPGWTTQHPSCETDFPTSLPYGQVATVDQPWLPHHHQTQHPQHQQFQAHTTIGSDYKEDTSTSRPGYIEEWPE
ncbi:MAG: hypothetical protein Q9168_002444 [Polycauliona sp. 1 TL-2023]